MYENQNDYEKEISLIEMMFYCLKKWRWILAAMLLLGALAALYKYQAVAESNEALLEAQTLDDADVTKKEEVIVNPSIAYYELAIERAEKDLAQRDEYLKESLMMQLNPNEVSTGILSFYVNVEGEEENILDSLFAAYRAFVTDGRLTERLCRIDDKVSQADLQNLISFKSGRTGAVIGNSELFMQSEKDVFQVQIKAANERMCEKYLKEVESAILEYAESLQSDAAPHQIKLLAAAQSLCVDEEIRNNQKSFLDNYTALISNLKTLRSTLETVRSEEGETIVLNEELSLDNPMKSAIKFAVIGMVAGLFLSVLVLVVVYCMSSKLQSTEQFEEEYGMRLIGRVAVPTGKGKLFGFLDRFIWRLEEGAYANIPEEEQVKIVSANLKAAISSEESLKKVMLAGTIAEKDAEAFCKKLTKDIEGVTFSAYKQPIFNAEAVEELKDFDAVVFLEKKGLSTSKLIKQEREQAVLRSVHVLGTIVLS